MTHLAEYLFNLEWLSTLISAGNATYALELLDDLRDTSVSVGDIECYDEFHFGHIL